jgi:hypothetical protein
MSFEIAKVLEKVSRIGTGVIANIPMTSPSPKVHQVRIRIAGTQLS